jgi:hypothetical protein
MAPRKQVFSHMDTIPAINVKNANLCFERKVLMEGQIRKQNLEFNDF